MPRRLPSLAALRAFDAGGRHLNFSRAAAELGLTQSAVSRHVATLEATLGVPLFDRRPGRVVLTADGRDYLAAVQDSFDGLESATLRIEGRAGREILTLYVPPTLAMRWLMPRLQSFSDENRAIEIRLVTSAHAADFSRDDIDAAIRIGIPPGGPADLAAQYEPMLSGPADVRIERLMADRLVAVFSPQLPSAPHLREARDLAAEILLHTTTRRAAWPEWQAGNGVAGLTGKSEAWFGHFFMTYQAVCEARGVAVIPELFVARELATGILRELPCGVTSRASYHLLYRAARVATSKLRLFRDWIHGQADGPTPGPQHGMMS